MGIRRARLLRRLRAADHESRLRVYHPVVRHGDDEVPVMVHSKVTVIDDRVVRIGSANLNNRSMGLDSECDLAVEAGGDAGLAGAIRGVRDNLLAEHLGVPAKDFAAIADETQSLIGAIERLQDGQHDLRPIEIDLPETVDALLPSTDLLDPERPVAPERLARELIDEDLAQPETRKRLYRVLVILILLVGLAALWRWSPLAGIVDASTLEAWGTSIQNSAYAGAIVIGVYMVAGLSMFPVVVLIAVTGVLFGPLIGFVYAMLGLLSSAAVTFAVGNMLGRRTIQRLAGTRIDSLSRRLARRGILSVAGVRLVPIAPFSVINLAAGASHIRFFDYLVGTLIGTTPGVLVLTVFSAQLRRLIAEPQVINAAVLIVALLIGGLGAYWLHRKASERRRHKMMEPAGD